MKRFKANKKKSMHKFKHDVKHTKAANVHPLPMRGGYRL